MEFAVYSRFDEILRQRKAEGAAYYIASLGFSAVEIPTSAHALSECAVTSPEQGLRLGEILRRAGLRVCCYSSSADLFSEGSGEWEGRLREHVRRAAAVGSPYLHHTLIPWLTLPDDAPLFDDARMRVTEAAVRVAEYARSMGLRCLYEPQGMYCNGSERFSAFYRGIRACTDNVGICADTGNPMFADDTLLPVLQEFPGEIYHVHIKDYHREEAPFDGEGKLYRTRGGAYLRETAVGTGDVDFPEVMRLLQQSGYRGAFAFEIKGLPFDERVRQTMRYLETL